MSPASKWLLAFALLASTYGCWGEEPVTAADCADGVCVVNVLSAELIVAPCDGETVQIAYSKTSAAALIQCSDPSNPEGNRTLIFDRNTPGGGAFELQGGRFIRPDYLATAQSGGIPDKFGSVPLCSMKERPKATPGELLVAEKTPTNSQDAPYCYHVDYVRIEGGTLRVKSDVGHELSPVTAEKLAAWAGLREALTPYMQTRTVASQRTATVMRGKARLYNAPDSASASKSYLVKGDIVQILDDSKRDWVRIAYVTKAGKKIEKWMQAGDLDVGRK